MELENILRQTGEIRPGDHLAVLYENSGEIVEPLTAYIHAALKRNERCIYITGDADSVRVLDLLERLKNNEGVRGELQVYIIQVHPVLLWENREQWSLAGTAGKGN